MSDQTQSRPRRSGRHRAIRATATGIVIVVAGAAIIGTVVVSKVNDRMEHRHDLESRRIVLAADPISIAVPGSGSVIETFVEAGDQVSEGVTLLKVRYQDPADYTDTITNDLAAPSRFVVTRVRAVRGGSIVGGAEIVQGFNPERLYFTIPVSYSEARRIQRDSTVMIDLAGFGKMKAVAGPLESDFDSLGVSESGRKTRIRLYPTEPLRLTEAGVVPGVTFSGSISLAD